MTALSVTILGSGTCVPDLKRSACAVLVEIGRSKILLDIGPGTMRRLLEYGVTIFELTHVLISHFHPDHTSELVPLLFATKYPEAQRRKHPLKVYAGQGLNAHYAGLQTVYGQWIVLPEYQLSLHEMDPVAGLLKFDGFSLSARSVAHRPESLAYRIDTAQGLSVVYSGDTDACESLIDLAKGTDLLICEASMPDGQKVTGHLTPSIAGSIAARADAKRLVLTHLYPPCDKVDIVKQARSTYKGPIVMAEDLMTFCF